MPSLKGSLPLKHMRKEEIRERLSRLYRLHAAGIKLDLNVTRQMLAELGEPQRALRCVHVAGTNGKGSVCAMLEAMFRAAGFKTGLYTSPHLIKFNERIRVNGACISDEALAELIPLVEKAAAAAAAAPAGREATFFEVTTVLAFEFFRRSGVDMAIIETGMGGRLDATNTITPALSVITGIALEHTQFLGPDIRHIAAEKAGIIKPGAPVVTGPLEAEAREVVFAAASAAGSRVVEASETVAVQRTGRPDIRGQKLQIQSAAESYGVVRLPLHGRHQMENSAIAVAAFEEACRTADAPVPAKAVKRGLESVVWPARCQIVRENPTTVVDAAHNPEAASALAQTLREITRGPLGLVVGMCSDKDARSFLAAFAGQAAECWLVPMRTERSMPTSELAAAAAAAGLKTRQATVPQALEEAINWAETASGTVCITGSFYLAGEALELLAGSDIFGPGAETHA